MSQGSSFPEALFLDLTVSCSKADVTGDPSRPTARQNQYAIDKVSEIDEVVGIFVVTAPRPH